MCLRQKPQLLIVLMGIAGSLRLKSQLFPVSLLCHYLQLPLAGAPSCASNRVCQFINPSCSRRMLFVSPWTMGPDSQSQSVLRDNQGFSFFPIQPQHIAHLSLPSLSTWLNIVTSLMNYVSLSVSLLFLSVSLPWLSQYVFYTVLLQSYLKASDFNKTIKKGNIFYLFVFFPCVSLVI